MAKANSKTQSGGRPAPSPLSSFYLKEIEDWVVDYYADAEKAGEAYFDTQPTGNDNVIYNLLSQVFGGKYDHVIEALQKCVECRVAHLDKVPVPYVEGPKAPAAKVAKQAKKAAAAPVQAEASGGPKKAAKPVARRVVQDAPVETEAPKGPKGPKVKKAKPQVQDEVPGGDGDANAWTSLGGDTMTDKQRATIESYLPALLPLMDKGGERRVVKAFKKHADDFSTLDASKVIAILLAKYDAIVDPERWVAGYWQAPNGSHFQVLRSRDTKRPYAKVPVQTGTRVGWQYAPALLATLDVDRCQHIGMRRPTTVKIAA